MTTTTKQEFEYETSESGLGYNAPQVMGRRLWLPMFAMALMGFGIGIVLAIARASIVSDFGVDDAGAKQLAHFVPAFMFIGFAGVLGAVSFAIARILGAFRKGGGDVQEAVGAGVQTLKMPVTARIFMAGMMMGMMLIVGAVIIHFGVASSAADWAVADVERWARALEGFRRLGVALYLAGIAFGLGTIIHVLRFQAQRIRALAGAS